MKKEPYKMPYFAYLTLVYYVQTLTINDLLAEKLIFRSGHN